MRRWLCTSLVLTNVMLVTLWLPSVRAAQELPASDFVQVRGAQLWLQGRPFRFVGANVSVIHGPNERAGYEQVLDAVAADGLKVVRIWALGEVTGPEKPYHSLYAFRIGEQGWVEESFAHLDKVLAAAKARDLRVILVLANRWKDYGGIGAYLTWAGIPVERDERGEPLHQPLTTFIQCARCQALYREHVSRVVGRVNAVTQLAYRDDPTIMAWELINEASAVSAREEEALVSWVRETARFVRSIDANHLISAGHVGYSTTRERAVWSAVQALPEVDFADAHLYPYGDPRVTNTAQLARFMDDPLALAEAVIKKPLVFGEFGFDRKGPAGAYVERLRWMRAFLRHAAERNTSGALVWLYEPAANPRRRHTITADPKDKSSRYVRSSLAAAAAQFGEAGANPARVRWLGSKELPRFVQHETVRERVAPHRGFVSRSGAELLEIEPRDLALMSFEHVGVYDGGPLDSVWGAGEGFVEYRFEAPRGVPKGVVVEARISSELPGFGDGQDARDGSDVEISIDGEVLAVVRAKPDDGLGDLVRAELTDARALRKIFGHSGQHQLRLRALPSHFAGGLCIYGKPTGNMPLDPKAERDLASIRVTLLR